MYILIETPSINENLYEYDVFTEEYEIDFKNILFHAKAYSLKSVSPRYRDSLHVYISEITLAGKEALEKDLENSILKKVIKNEVIDSFPIEENDIIIEKVEKK